MDSPICKRYFVPRPIPAGSTISNSVDGASLGPLRATNPIGLDITSLIQTSDLVPGSDLTVIIRL